jgi:hypothetical protein
VIDDYAFGRIVIDGRTYQSDVIVYPGRVDNGWWRVSGHELAVTDLEAVLADPPAVLVVGTGRYGRMVVLPETEQALADRGVALVAQPTAAACQTYNERLSAGERVVAALHLTC